MKNKKIFSPIHFWLVVFLMALYVFGAGGIFISCGRAGPKMEEQAVQSLHAGAEALAILQSGKFPLWFEFTENGPRHIESPDLAAIEPLKPWPLSRHCPAMLPLTGSLIMAVNRSGFLVLDSEDESRMGLYHIGQDEVWPEYSVASLFAFNEESDHYERLRTAAVLFYRDDFFFETSAPLPEPQSLSLNPVSLQSRAAAIPAFSRFSTAQGWDIEVLFEGADGNWYCLARNKGEPQGKKHYYKSAGLKGESEASSLAAFRKAARPQPLKNAPPSLAAILEKLSEAEGPGRLSYGEIISPAWDSKRSFTGEISFEAAEKELIRLSGFWDEDRAIAINPQGKGFRITSAAGTADAPRNLPPEPYSLPPLPDTYVYTGIALLEGSLVATWEEQQDLTIGAAGFMVLGINLPSRPPGGRN